MALTYSCAGCASLGLDDKQRKQSVEILSCKAVAAIPTSAVVVVEAADANLLRLSSDSVKAPSTILRVCELIRPSVLDRGGTHNTAF